MKNSELYQSAAEISSRAIVSIGTTNLTSGLLIWFDLMGSFVGFLVAACSLFLLWPKMKKDIKERFFDDETGSNQ